MSFSRGAHRNPSCLRNSADHRRHLEHRDTGHAEIFDPATNTLLNRRPHGYGAHCPSRRASCNSQVLVTGGFGIQRPLLLSLPRNSMTPSRILLLHREHWPTPRQIIRLRCCLRGKCCGRRRNPSGIRADGRAYDPMRPFSSTTTQLDRSAFSRANLPDGTVFLADGPTNGRFMILCPERSEPQEFQLKCGMSCTNGTFYLREPRCPNQKRLAGAKYLLSAIDSITTVLPTASSMCRIRSSCQERRVGALS